ncbi:hypothetical protein AV530_011276 [Patagioenas fasciata monilis]|uniref:Uncharacterized protein n=1 Tax=Patagioenas fasciata monilis TaxID=372326 RepID=A0A1V4KNU1_PATFA|nr:hypothetical protein AV530_011276 [Patagioenas fasciata monilis]
MSLLVSKAENNCEVTLVIQSLDTRKRQTGQKFCVLLSSSSLRIVPCSHDDFSNGGKLKITREEQHNWASKPISPLSLRQVLVQSSRVSPRGIGAVQSIWIQSMTSKGAGLEQITEIIQSMIQGTIGSE